MAAVEQGPYVGPRPLVQEKPLCRFHHSVEMVQPVAGTDPNDYDAQVIRSKAPGTCNPANNRAPFACTEESKAKLGQGSPPARINPASLHPAGRKVRHNDVVRPGILNREHSARLENGTWVNHPDYANSPPRLDKDGAPMPRGVDEGYDTWGWEIENREDNAPPSPTRGHENYPELEAAEVKWRSSVSMSGVRIKREAHGLVPHCPSALEVKQGAPPGPADVIPPWATDLNP